MQKAKIDLPKCWKRLVDTVFEDGDHGYVVVGTQHPVTCEHHQKGNDDPEPHYDDARTVATKFPNGAVLALDLCSGQGNYYGGATISHEQEVVHDAEPLESFDDNMEFQGEDGETYQLEIIWTGDDPYENGYE
jgi:hypothetical protein